MEIQVFFTQFQNSVQSKPTVHVVKIQSELEFWKMFCIQRQLEPILATSLRFPTRCSHGIDQWWATFYHCGLKKSCDFCRRLHSQL